MKQNPCGLVSIAQAFSLASPLESMVVVSFLFLVLFVRSFVVLE